MGSTLAIAGTWLKEREGTEVWEEARGERKMKGRGQGGRVSWLARLAAADCSCRSWRWHPGPLMGPWAAGGVPHRWSRGRGGLRPLDVPRKRAAGRVKGVLVPSPDLGPGSCVRQRGGRPQMRQCALRWSLFALSVPRRTALRWKLTCTSSKTSTGRGGRACT